MKKTFLPSEAKSAIANEDCPSCGAKKGEECPDGARRNSRRVAMKACAARIRLDQARKKLASSAGLSDEAATVLSDMKKGYAASESRPGSGVFVLQAFPTRAIFGRTNKRIIQELESAGVIRHAGTTGRHFYVATEVSQ